MNAQGYVSTRTAKVTRIENLPRLDPIHVVWLDLDARKGYVVIQCYERAWSAYWNAMGQGYSTERFFASCDVDYLLGSFVAGLKITKSDQAYLRRIIEAVHNAVRAPRMYEARGDGTVRYYVECAPCELRSPKLGSADAAAEAWNARDLVRFDIPEVA